MNTAAPQWLLLIYRVPSEPARIRVTIWREMKRIGALYLQQCVCIVPRTEALAEELERVQARIEDSGGEAMCVTIPALRPEDERKIIASFREARNKEYNEIARECEKRFVKEIEFHRFRQAYSFEEVEEISQDLEKLRRWFARIVERDWFEAERRSEVAALIDRCQALLDSFEQDVYERENPEESPAGESPKA